MKSFLLIVAVLLCVIVRAQSDFRDGFIISLNKDTIPGKVDYRSNKRNYEACKFRNKSGVTEIFSNEEILAFGYVVDKLFSSQVLDGEFVEVLVDGDLSLYRGSKGYYLEQDESLILLEVLKDRPESARDYGNGRGIPEDNRWKNILFNVVQSCLGNRVKERINELRFQEKAITKVVLDYNACRKSEVYIPKSGKPWLVLSPGLVIAWTSSGLDVTNNAVGLDLILSEEYSSNNDLVFGASLELKSPRVSDNFSFYSELLYVSANYQGSELIASLTNTDFGDSNFRGSLYNADINLSQLSIPLALKFRKHFGPNSLGFFGGLHSTFNLEREISYTMQEVEIDQISQDVIEDTYDLSPVFYGVWGGLEFSRRFGLFSSSLGLRYFQGRRINQESGFRIAYDRFSIALILSK